jgi:predicted nucleic acid-binding protein
MLLPDVNLLVYAQREDLSAHADARNWLESALNGVEPVGLFDPTLASLVLRRFLWVQ